MLIRLVGVEPLTQLMASDRRRETDSSWLLFGPTDTRAIDMAPVSADREFRTLWAAE